ncbi:MAG: YicC family protein [Phycisphaerales bacterium]|nr:YicC family protein [Planctomycetota bacterium]MBL6996995.1 YicC family protein [Phycisphaerales bacterium]
MLRSMTGFGSTSSRKDGVSLQVEIRTVNNKFYKANVRLPEPLQSLETEIDVAVSKLISRGSVTVNVKFIDTSEHGIATINKEVLANYIDQIKGVDPSVSVDVSRLLTLPGVLNSDTDDDVAIRNRSELMTLVEGACNDVIEMRKREGKDLEEDLCVHLVKIEEHLSLIRERAPQIVEEYQTRLRQRVQNLLSEIGKNVEEEDVLREVAVFAEKTDIAEEISRLAGHLTQFRELINGCDQEPVGRTLDFLSQEMLRESNTIASKCLDGDTSRRIVEIKGAVDRIKEQVQNAE